MGLTNQKFKSNWRSVLFLLIFAGILTISRELAKLSFFERLKVKWGTSSNVQIFLIFTAFAINGSFAAWVASPLTELLGLSKQTTDGFLYWPLRILLVFPVYQITLPISGFFLGQFKFFWAFELKMLRALGRLFGRRKTQDGNVRL